MYTLEERLAWVEENKQAVKNLIDMYSESMADQCEKLWVSVYYINSTLHEFCNAIEEGTFDQDQFYDVISDMLGRPKEL